MKLPPVSSSLAALAVTMPLDEGPETFRCIDGTLNVFDIARAAGVSGKAARRAVDAYIADKKSGRSESGGATLSFDSEGTPLPETQTRAEMAVIVAKLTGIGHFGIERRVAERKATRPPAPPKEKRVSTNQHPWRLEEHGRSIKGSEGGGIMATLICSKSDCQTKESIHFRQLCGAPDMDRKFIQRGWGTDPATCPDHNRRNHHRKDSTMNGKTSAAAIAAQGKMFVLLQTHFNPDVGTYDAGWGDQKIATECGLSVDLVAGVRAQAFGELKEPPEIARLASDIETLSGLLEEAVAPIRTELASLRARLSEVRKKFAA